MWNVKIILCSTGVEDGRSGESYRPLSSDERERERFEMWNRSGHRWPDGTVFHYKSR